MKIGMILADQCIPGKYFNKSELNKPETPANAIIIHRAPLACIRRSCISPTSLRMHLSVSWLCIKSRSNMIRRSQTSSPRGHISGISLLPSYKDARDFFDRAPAEIRDDHIAGPGRNVSCKSVGRPQAEHLVPYYDFPSKDDEWHREQRPDAGRVPSALLRDNHGGSLCACRDLGFDLLCSEVGSHVIARIGGVELGLVGTDQAIDDGTADERGKPCPHHIMPSMLQSSQCAAWQIGRAH